MTDLFRGATEIIGRKDLERKLKEGKTLKIKHGVDATSPDLHLGHAVNYFAMRRFQEKGHNVLFLLGDFTSRIGDPTDKLEARKEISKAEIEQNLKDFVHQATKILDKEKTEIKRNSQWWDNMKLEDFLKIAKNISAVRLWERNMFQERIEHEKPVWTHEFLYPILQGYDSVALESDLTIIGSDQKFNELVGRELQKIYGQQPQALIIMPILPGIDGKEKMGKSLGNYIAINDRPDEKFGKIMSIPDNVIEIYEKLLLEENIEESDPYKHKLLLAEKITERFDGIPTARTSKENFIRVFKEKKLPVNVREIKIAKKEIALLDVLLESDLAKSKSDARRLIKEGAIEIDGKIEKNDSATLKINEQGLVIKKGKRYFVKIKR